MRCFYDADEQIELWGWFLAEELPTICGEQAAAVVVFISAEYVGRNWTRLERRAALARAVRERQEYLALLARWYYSSWREGEWLAFESYDEIPYRKLVNAVSRVARRD